MPSHFHTRLMHTPFAHWKLNWSQVRWNSGSWAAGGESKGQCGAGGELSWPSESTAGPLLRRHGSFVVPSPHLWSPLSSPPCTKCLEMHNTTLTASCVVGIFIGAILTLDVTITHHGVGQALLPVLAHEVHVTGAQGNFWGKFRRSGWHHGRHCLQEGHCHLHRHV